VGQLTSTATGALVVAAVVLSVVDLASQATTATAQDSLRPALQAALAVGWAVPGIVLALRRSSLPFGYLAQLAAATHAVAAVLVVTAPEGRWSVWIASWLIVVELPVLAALVQLFPTGRPLAGWRPYLMVSVGAGVLGVVAAAIEAVPAGGPTIGDVAGAVSVPLLAFAALGGVVPLALRWRRTSGGERRAVAWLLAILAAGVVVPAMVAAGGQSGEVAAQVFTVAQLAFICVAVLRSRVWGLAPMTQRSVHRVVSATDAERRRIRGELHDGVGAGLTAVRLKVDAASRLIEQRPERAAEMLDSASADIGSVLDDVRGLIDGLRPPVLDRMDLGAALRQRADELSAHAPGLSISVVDGAMLAQLSPGADVSVYRLVSEAMNNVVRHSGATRCEVRVSARDGEVVIDVSDDGRGTDDTTTSGLGLSSMATRASEVGGHLVTGARPDRGFRVRAVIPRDPTWP